MQSNNNNNKKEEEKKIKTAQDLYDALALPFERDQIKVRPGAISKISDMAIPLFYLDAREVTKRLNDVCGLDGWATDQEPIVAGDKIIGAKCRLSIRVPGTDSRGNEIWVSKTDFGEASQSSPVKGAASDALKRAAVLFGVGRFLYYIQNFWWPYDKKTRKFKKGEKGNDKGKDVMDKMLEEFPFAKPGVVKKAWEKKAAERYDASKDIDLEFLTPDQIEYVDEEARKELIAHLRQKES